MRGSALLLQPSIGIQEFRGFKARVGSRIAGSTLGNDLLDRLGGNRYKRFFSPKDTTCLQTLQSKTTTLRIEVGNFQNLEFLEDFPTWVVSSSMSEVKHASGESCLPVFEAGSSVDTVPGVGSIGEIRNELQSVPVDSFASSYKNHDNLWSQVVYLECCKLFVRWSQ